MSDADKATFGWDASHHDWGRGAMDIAAAARSGIQFMTHKCAEGHHFYTDERFDDFIGRARAAGVPLLGAYFVNHPGDQRDQVEWFISLLDAKAKGWRDGPFLVQLDAEKFDYMTRAPSPAEIRAWCDEFTRRVPTHRPIVYAPRWLYGDTLRGLPYPLWASAYGSNPAEGYLSAYPGDGSTRWAAYSGQTPAILQYGSRTTIGAQRTCDANAFRGTLAQLVALTTGDDDMTPDEMKTAVVQGIHAALDQAATRSTPTGRQMGDDIATLLAPVRKPVEELAARPQVQPAPVDVAALAAALKPELSALVDAAAEAAVRRVLGAVDGATPATPVA